MHRGERRRVGDAARLQGGERGRLLRRERAAMLCELLWRAMRFSPRRSRLSRGRRNVPPPKASSASALSAMPCGIAARAWSRTLL